MAPGEEDIFHHVRDFPYFHLPAGIHLWLPRIDLFGFHFQLTKFMVLQVFAGLFLLFVFRGLSRRIASGQVARGGWWNFWETLAVYIRDNVVRPTIGEGDHHGHEGDEHARPRRPRAGPRGAARRCGPPGGQVSSLTFGRAFFTC